MEKNTSTMDYRAALLNDGGKPLQNNGKSAGEIAREKQFWKRVHEENKRLGLGSHPSGPSYLDLLQDAPANVRNEFLKDAPANVKERFYKYALTEEQELELEEDLLLRRAEREGYLKKHGFTDDTN